jgi:hypothetical protein
MEAEVSFFIMAMHCFSPSGRGESPYPVLLFIYESFIVISSGNGIFRMKINFHGMQWLQIQCTPVNVGNRLLVTAVDINSMSQLFQFRI